jgi:uroporphyrin-3 C-methyltransferase
MTEHENSSAVVEETKAADGVTPLPEKAEKKRRANRTSLALSAIAIAIALASGAGLYGWVKHQNKTLQTSNGEIADQLIALQQTQDKQRTELEGVIKQQADALAAEKRQSEALAKQLDEVQQKVATISGSDAKTWQLAQADFLVKLAGRKLWSDQDVTTAAALL